MSEFENYQTTMNQIEELEDVIAYSTVVGATVTVDGNGDYTVEVHETPW